METDMDLTNLNSTCILADIQILHNELKKHLEIEEKLPLEIDAIRDSLLKYKPIYEAHITNSEYLQNEIDSLQCYSDGLVTLKEESNEAETLKIQIESLQDDLDNLKINSEKVVTNLKVSIDEEQHVPVLENSDSFEVWEIKEKNVMLKEENDSISNAIDESDIRIIELSQQTSSLELELIEVKHMLDTVQQANKESKKSYQEKMEEKAILLASLNQINRKPLAEFNQKSSLFDEVNDDRSEATSKYQILKNKCMKAKSILNKNNDEIKKLKAELLKQKHNLSEMEYEASRSNDDLNFSRMQRIKDLEKCIKMLEGKKNQSKDYVINSSNFSNVEYFSEIAKAEEKRIHDDIMKTLALKHPLEQKLSSSDRELKINLKQIKQKIEANSELEQQLNQLKNNEICNSNTACGASKISSEATTKKSIRFAEEIKYHDES